MRLFGASVGIVAALVVLLSWVDQPPGPDSGSATNPGDEPDAVSVVPASPEESTAGVQAASIVAEVGPDSDADTGAIEGASATTDLLPDAPALARAQAPAPAPGSAAGPGAEADQGADTTMTAGLEDDPTLQWHLFMRPFGSAYKAEGFVNYLSRTTGIPLTTVRQGVGEYRVALGYHDATELQERISIIEASTGLDAKGDLR